MGLSHTGYILPKVLLKACKEKKHLCSEYQGNGFQGTELMRVIRNFLVPEHGVLWLLRLVFRRTNFSSVGSMVKAAATMDASLRGGGPW